MSKLAFRKILVRWSKEGLTVLEIFGMSALLWCIVAVGFQLLFLRHSTSDLLHKEDAEVISKSFGRAYDFVPVAVPAFAQKDVKKLKEFATYALQDKDVQKVSFYDASRKLFLESRAESLTLPKSVSLDKTLGWSRILAARSLESRPMSTRLMTIDGTRYVDVVIRFDAPSHTREGKTFPIGFVRLLVQLNSTSEKFSEIYLFGTLASVATGIICSFLLFFILKLTIQSPIRRAMEFVRLLPLQSDKPPKLYQSRTDALELRKFLAALYNGFAEISTRQRMTRFIESTKLALKTCDENMFLTVAQAKWIESELALNCRVIVAKINIQRTRFKIEKTSERPNAEVNLQNVSSDSPMRAQAQEIPVDLQDDVVLLFLRQNKPYQWVKDVLFACVPIGPESDSYIVVAIRANANAGIPPARYEQLVQVWCVETANIYHQTRSQNFAGKIEIALELQRKLIQSDVPESEEAQSSLLSSALGYESIPGQSINGDFIFVQKYEKRNCSLVVMGDVTGVDLRAGLAATGIVAVLTDRFHFLKDAVPHVILEEIIQSINRYMYVTYAGKLATGCMALYFNHDTGQGLMACFGQPFPYVFSARERKPMVIVPQSQHGMLGIDTQLNFECTPFSVFPGQVIFACTSGLLEVEDPSGKKFEKVIHRGALSDITEQYLDKGAPVLLSKFIECARTHVSHGVLKDDLTGAVFIMTNSVKANFPKEKSTENLK